MSRVNYEAGVLLGEVEQMCLVCEDVFMSPLDAAAHAQLSRHKLRFAETHYVDGQFSGHRIRKIKNWYFCELCKALISSSYQVPFHISSDKHTQLKNSNYKEDEETYGYLFRLPMPQYHLIVSSPDLRLGEKAWNGIVDDNCIVCDEVFEDERCWIAHVKIVSHLIKVITMKTYAGPRKELFRKIDSDVIQCLTCNEAFPQTEGKLHFASRHHYIMYAKCAKDHGKTISQTGNNLTKEFVKITELTTLFRPFSESKDDYEPANVKKNNGNEKNQGDFEHDPRNTDVHKICKNKIKAFKNLNNDLNFDSSKETDCHKKEAENEKEQTCNLNTDDMSLEEFASYSNMKLRKKCIHCSYCKIHIPKTMQHLRQHVFGKNHKALVLVADKVNGNPKYSNWNIPYIPMGPPAQSETATGSAPSKLGYESTELGSAPRSKSFNAYVQSIIAVQEQQKILINESICVDVLSFHFIKDFGAGIGCCHACDEYVIYKDHMKEDSHLYRVAMADILTIATDFLREIRLDKYHCGFCNIVLLGWKVVPLHLASPEHERRKAAAGEELAKYLPILKRHLRMLPLRQYLKRTMKFYEQKRVKLSCPGGLGDGRTYHDRQCEHGNGCNDFEWSNFTQTATGRKALVKPEQYC